MIIFENQGEADVLALTMLGVSVKVADNPIGFFGTGFKCAVAVLLRLGARLTVFSGEEELRFVTRPVEIRGRRFEIVELRRGADGAPESLGFTTEYAKIWQPWMAYRELYCNARDEGGAVYAAATAGAATDPRPGLTQVRVENAAALSDVHARHTEYFLEEEPDARLDGVNVHRRPSRVVFYRGVRVLELPHPTALTYDLTRRMDLTEDRTLAHPFMVDYYVTRALAGCADRSVVEEALTGLKDGAETRWDWKQAADAARPAYLQAIGGLIGRGAAVPSSAVATWEDARQREFVPVQEPLTADEKRGLDRAVAAALAVGLPLRAEDVGVTATLPGDAAYLIAREKVWVARTAVGDLTGQLLPALFRGCLELAGADVEAALLERLVSVGMARS
jgi:hypothetical protein